MVRLVNRAKMTTATTGTGTITLGTASDGFQTFAGAGVVDGDVVRYVIEEGTAFELGSGVFSSAGDTLTRNPSESSAGGGAITLTGNALVFVGAASEDVQSDVTINGGTIDGTVIGGASAAAGTFTTVTASGDVTIADKIVHSGDTDTAIRFPAANTVTVETNGSERLRITSAGDVGIGTSSPAAKLDVSADALIHGATVGRGGGGISTNTANGFQALRDNTTGAGNTANGREALLNNTTGASNTANGREALLNNTTGASNTANGRDALRDNTTGNDNTANGVGALRNNTTGTNNIGIGANAGRSTSPRTITTASNEICIGNNSHTGAFIKIAFTVTSDARDKTELAPIPHGLNFVNALQPTEYQFKVGGRDGAADGIRRYGFLAQDVLAAESDTPVIVNNDDPDSLKMTHDYLIPVLVNAVKELTAQVNDLMAEVAALKGQ